MMKLKHVLIVVLLFSTLVIGMSGIDAKTYQIDKKDSDKKIKSIFKNVKNKDVVIFKTANHKNLDLTLKKSITIKTKGKVKIRSLTINADKTKVSGLTLQQITVKGKYNTIQKNIVENHKSSGYIFYDPAYNRPYDGSIIIYGSSNKILSNKIRNNNNSCGIVILDAATKNIVRENLIYKNSLFGILLYSGEEKNKGNTIIRNTIKYNGKHGLFLEHSDNNYIKLNRIISNSGIGIVVNKAFNNQFIKNNIQKNKINNITYTNEIDYRDV